MSRFRSSVAVLVAGASVVACRERSDPVTFAIQADRFDGAEWSEPVNHGPLVNSGFVDANASLSPNGHVLYFISTRPGGFGNNDIWMSERQCLACPWEEPVNLGAVINTNAAGDVWGPPVNLGPDVNTAAAEQGSYYVKVSGEANASVYFNRPSPGGSTDIYKVFVSHDGVPLGPAFLVPELSDPTGFDQKVSVSTDGHELFFASIRDGGLGSFDIYRLTRQSISDPWSALEHLDAPINTPDIDSQPA